MDKMTLTIAHDETNFMGGISYRLDPLDTLRMVTASGIFAEPQYYRDGEFAKATLKDASYLPDELIEAYLMLGDHFNGKKTSEVMETIIDEALDFDFEAVLKWAVILRSEYHMRLNPQVIMVRAAMHKDRPAFCAGHPGLFARTNAAVMQRADEPAAQLAYCLYRNGSAKRIPNILKRSWAAKLSGLDAYQVHKYKNTGLGMIDVVRLSHASSLVLDELMKTGTVNVEEEKNTWEAMRSNGKTWKEICLSGVMGHMALLRNLRNIFTEIDDPAMCSSVLNDLKAGVATGKQFPFRYYSALEAVGSQSEVHHRPQILSALEECIDISCENMPKLKGKTMCLSDNSGSAWGAFTSEYGKVTVGLIDNLSSVITAAGSEEGYVGKFGDNLKIYPIAKRNGILNTAKEISQSRDGDVGGATENGIWIFFREALKNKEHWDNIFIYSDMQAGHGGLYGTDQGIEEYREAGYLCRKKYVDVAKLIAEYRRTVNPKVNVYCVQTAGYTNVLVPEYCYRTSILYGWTGKELIFADEMNRFWDEMDRKHQNDQ